MCAGARAAVIGLPGATVTHGLSDKPVLTITISQGAVRTTLPLRAQDQVLKQAFR